MISDRTPSSTAALAAPENSPLHEEILGLFGEVRTGAGSKSGSGSVSESSEESGASTGAESILGSGSEAESRAESHKSEKSNEDFNPLSQLRQIAYAHRSIIQEDTGSSSKDDSSLGLPQIQIARNYKSLAQTHSSDKSLLDRSASMRVSGDDSAGSNSSANEIPQTPSKQVTTGEKSPLPESNSDQGKLAAAQESRHSGNRHSAGSPEESTPSRSMASIISKIINAPGDSSPAVSQAQLPGKAVPTPSEKPAERRPNSIVGTIAAAVADTDRPQNTTPTRSSIQINNVAASPRISNDDKTAAPNSTQTNGSTLLGRLLQNSTDNQSSASPLPLIAAPVEASSTAKLLKPLLTNASPEKADERAEIKPAQPIRGIGESIAQAITNFDSSKTAPAVKESASERTAQVPAEVSTQQGQETVGRSEVRVQLAPAETNRTERDWQVEVLSLSSNSQSRKDGMRVGDLLASHIVTGGGVHQRAMVETVHLSAQKIPTLSAESVPEAKLQISQKHAQPYLERKSEFSSSPAQRIDGLIPEKSPALLEKSGREIAKEQLAKLDRVSGDSNKLMPPGSSLDKAFERRSDGKIESNKEIPGIIADLRNNKVEQGLNANSADHRLLSGNQKENAEQVKAFNAPPKDAVKEEPTRKDTSDKLKQNEDRKEAVLFAVGKTKKDSKNSDGDKSAAAKKQDEKESRKRYCVRPGDTLKSIAEAIFFDERFALLLELINRGDLQYKHEENGTRQVVLRVGQEIWLPTNAELTVHRNLFFSSRTTKEKTKESDAADLRLSDEASRFESWIKSIGTKAAQKTNKQEAPARAQELWQNPPQLAPSETMEMDNSTKSQGGAAAQESSLALAQMLKAIRYSGQRKAVLPEFIIDTADQIHTISADFQISLVRNCLDDSAFAINLEQKIQDKWVLIASYKSERGHTARYLYRMNGLRKEFNLQLPEQVVKNMALQDFNRNYKSYSAQYLSTPSS